MTKEIIPGTLFAIFVFLVALDQHDHRAALVVALAAGFGWLSYVPTESITLRVTLWFCSVLLFTISFILLAAKEFA